jgi:excinuclease UvrABC nuclease subunit
VDEALSLFDGAGDGSQRLLEWIEAQMSAAAAARRYERAAVLRRRHERLSGVLTRLDGMLRATTAGARLALARHPAKDRFDLFTIAGGRVVEWGPLEAAVDLDSRGAAASERLHESVVSPEEVDEIRIVSTWIAEHDPPSLNLSPPPAGERVRAWLAGAGAA